MVNNVQQSPLKIEDIGDPDWLYSTFTEEKLKEIKKAGILNFIAQWITITNLTIFVLLTDGFSNNSSLYFTIVACLANWTGSLAIVKLSYYLKIRRGQRRYVVRHGLLPWWQQKEFGGWK
jgi:hypothetical protein